MITSSYTNGNGDKMTRTYSSLAVLCAELRINSMQCSAGLVVTLFSGPPGLTRHLGVTHFCPVVKAQGHGIQ